MRKGGAGGVKAAAVGTKVKFSQDYNAYKNGAPEGVT